MPVFLAGREPDHVARTNFLDWIAPPLHAPAPSRHDQGLTERVCMSCRPRAWLKGNASAQYARGIGSVKQRIDADCTGKILGRSFAGRL